MLHITGKPYRKDSCRCRSPTTGIYLTQSSIHAPWRHAATLIPEHSPSDFHGGSSSALVRRWPGMFLDWWGNPATLCVQEPSDDHPPAERQISRDFVGAELHSHRGDEHIPQPRRLVSCSSLVFHSPSQSIMTSANSPSLKDIEEMYVYAFTRGVNL